MEMRGARPRGMIRDTALLVESLVTSEVSGIYTYIRIHRWTSHTIGQSHCIATYRKVSLNPSIAAHRTIAAYRGISRNIAEYRGISREIRGVAARSRTIAYHRRPSRDVAGRRDAAPSQDVATRTIAGACAGARTSVTSRRRLVEEVELGLLPAACGAAFGTTPVRRYVL